MLFAKHFEERIFFSTPRIRRKSTVHTHYTVLVYTSRSTFPPHSADDKEEETGADGNDKEARRPPVRSSTRNCCIGEHYGQADENNVPYTYAYPHRHTRT